VKNISEKLALFLRNLFFFLLRNALNFIPKNRLKFTWPDYYWNIYKTEKVGSMVELTSQYFSHSSYRDV